MSKKPVYQSTIDFKYLKISGLQDVQQNYSEFLSSVFLMEKTFEGNENIFGIYHDKDRKFILEVIPSAGLSSFAFRIGKIVKKSFADVIDDNKGIIIKNHVKPSMGGISWSYALISKSNKSGRYILAIENRHDGSPSSVEAIFQDIINKNIPPQSEFKKTVTFCTEDIPSQSFRENILQHKKVKSVTLRITRPNPGWEDLDSILASESQDSNSVRTDIKMTAPRGQFLSTEKGIWPELVDRLSKNMLDYAKVEAKIGDETKEITSKSLHMKSAISITYDEHGRISSLEILKEMNEKIEKLNV